MSRDRSGFPISRRRFAFWVGFGLFTLGEKLHARGLDDLAAAAMRAAESSSDADAASDTVASAEHWTPAENNSWRWFEREELVDGKWKLTGITTPYNKVTGEAYQGSEGYLDPSLVPDEVRYGTKSLDDVAAFEEDAGRPSPSRRARHGRPPSRWLRSLNADELHVWLKTIDPPPAGVSGMTYWTHLTRDHSFDPHKIEGLLIDDQAKLHAAAHYGY
ncbi:MAG: hypothetical protein DWQ37_21830 [Planctomycetota bacterium]|nr:MAG: hypothetical protein DWQ37_21830 [Planctomycetota bacterium]